jgi:hypothetical protein
MRPRRALACIVVGCLLPHPGATAAESPRYDRDIRPILSDHCFACHGPDAESRQAGLRLDMPQPEPPPTASGLAAITPGRPEASELVARILADDPDVVMPPPDTTKPLSSPQKQLLADWIAAGAGYERHWAYVPPVRPAPPPVANHRWPLNPIDEFVLARLEQEGLAPAREADRSTLIRRLSLDLTGLPPTRAEAEAFLADAAPDAYERLVERLLASPHYGERMAVDWLDAARYADTNGYQVDRDREQWLWRDWVIAAFNTNMPFDRFTIEQLAGDLLPEATREQRIATGFHRNHMLNEEGGIIPEEFLAEYTADRVETTATVWLGQTFNCARCHDHKFDPFTQRDFYALKAFFHGIDEKGIGNYSAHVRVNAPPFLRVATPDQEARLAELEAARAAAAAALDELRTVAAADADATDAAAADAIKQAVEQLAAHTKARDEFEASIPTALVMVERPEPRPTHILIRGDYTSPGAEVTAGTPAILPGMAADLPPNRLGLARWLVAPDNPLPARVTANRIWQAFFGTGLVATPEDFGSQGGLPSHPELLDWLAVEFRESGWDMKRLVRLIVTSATYRQASALSPGLADRDPANRLLARGPRFRLQAEFVRDQALAVSGLLVPRLGGPSVKPYHPPGLYEQVVNQRDNPDATYTPDTGPGLHRRSLYTYWKRSVPHPAMLAFDAPFRETCTVKRSQTNTPLQALTLMNDPTFVEAAKFLASRMIREGGDAAGERLAHGVWLVLARPPEPAELDMLGRAVERFRAGYAADAAAARALLAVGEAPLDHAIEGDAAARDLAAYTLIAQMLLCRDEVLMKN